MTKSKRIFLIADFKDESAQSIRIERRHWIKGFIRLGHDVQRFSYRNILLQQSPFKSVKASRMVAKKRTDNILMEQLKHYHPDIVMIAMMFVDADTVANMRKVAPNAFFVGREVSCPGRFSPSLEIARQMDLVIASNADKYLKAYKEAGATRCAFIPCPCEPDIQRPYNDVDKRFKTDILFSG